MTREEFNDIAKERGYDLEGQISQKDFKRIQWVYTYHPSISEDSTVGKRQIVDLVGTYGMRIINDMIPTAEKAARLERRIRAARIDLDSARDKLEALKRGEDVDV